MRQFLDTSVLVEACLDYGLKFTQADRLVNHPDSITSAHSMAETYATLSGNRRYNLRAPIAAKLVASLAEVLSVHALSADEYVKIISMAPAKGVQGGGIYDYLHAEVARRAGCSTIFTWNVGDFRHVAPDLTVREP